MAKTVNEAFQQFYSKILPGPDHFQRMERRRQIVHSALSRSFPPGSSMPLIRTHLIGSAAKGTMVVDGEMDIDVLAVFSNEKNAYQGFSSAQDLLYKVKNSISSRVQTIGSRGQAVRMFYTDKLHVDIAPVFGLTTGGYHLPGGNGNWIPTDPHKQIDWFKQRHSVLGNSFLLLVVLVKEWNKAHGKVLSAFHLETMIGATFTSLNGDVKEAFAMFFENAGTMLDINDPAGHSGNLSLHLTWQQRGDTINRFSNAAYYARQAITHEAIGNQKEAIRLWKIVFGGRFPSYE